MFWEKVLCVHKGNSVVAQRQHTLATTHRYECLDVLVRLLHNKYLVVPGCTSSIIHLINSRLACTVSNVTLNNVFQLKLVWCVAVFNATG